MADSVDTIYDRYLDNADYDVSNDVAKCKLFITACRQLMGLSKRSMKGGQGHRAETEYDVESIRKELVQARHWLSLNNDASDSAFGGGVVDVDFTEFDSRGL